jgi:hypothetical protein
MMKKYLVLIMMICILSASTAFGFATLTAPQGGDTVVFDANVNNVKVYLNGKLIGEKRNNSFVYKFRRVKEDQVLTFKKAGYDDEQIILTKTTTPMFWGNVLIGGTLGSSTDSIFTKNSMEYSPGQYYIELRKI